MELKSRMLLQPGLYLLAGVHREVIADNVDGADGGGDVLFHLRQKCNEFDLPFAFRTQAIDVAGTRIECRKKLERTDALVFMFQEIRFVSRSRRLGGMYTRPRLKRSLLVHTQHDLVCRQRTRVAVNHIVYPPVEFGVSGAFGRKPQMMTPRFQLVMCQDPADGLRRDGIHQSIGGYLVGEFRAIPLRHRAPQLVRPLAGDFDYMRGDSGLGKKASGRALVYPRAPRSLLSETGRPICRQGES